MRRTRVSRRACLSYAGLVVATAAVPGCTRAFTAPDELPERHTIVQEQLVIYSDFRLPTKHRLLQQLRRLREDLSESLALPRSDEPIHVYLFESAERFEGYLELHHPQLPSRRAFFLESDTRLSVYAHWGDRVAEDLRHEVSHGYMHAVVPNLPLWLDEGLAEYFEVPRAGAGVNRPHLDDLVARLATGWRPNLARLESLESISTLTQLDYAESWAWAHLLLHSSPQTRQLLHGYLATLRQEGVALPLSVSLPRILARPEQQLVEHLYRLTQEQ